MKHLERNECVVTGDNDLELLNGFDNFPVYMGCVDNNKHEEDLKLDMNFFISKGSGMVQLNPLVPLEILYKDSHGSGSMGDSWRRHHRALADFILKYESINIFEIGGGHGTLAREYIGKREKSTWTILEANPTPNYYHDRISFQKGIFDDSCVINNDIDTIVHSHLFEHIYNPMSFIKKLYDSLPNGGYTIFSVPFLEQQIRENITYCLGFEHTIFLNETFIEFFLQQAGFKIIDKQIYQENHSLFYCAQKKSDSCINVSLPNKYNEYLELFKNYFQYNENKVADLNRLISSSEEKVFLFGGHVASQYLISYGLNIECIESILDNDPKKQGRRLYGTNLKVRSPQVLRNMGKVNVILRQGVFNKEIKEDILVKINKNVVFWE